MKALLNVRVTTLTGSKEMAESGDLRYATDAIKLVNSGAYVGLHEHWSEDIVCKIDEYASSS